MDKITLVCDLVDKGYLLKIKDANIARHLLYHILRTKNYTVLEHYRNDQIYLTVANEYLLLANKTTYKVLDFKPKDYG